MRHALLLCLAALAGCSDPALDAGFTIGTGDDDGAEISISF